MKRIQLFEFEDFSWFPSGIRTCMTNLIVVLQRFMGTSEVVADKIREIRKRVEFTQIVDLGSGSGGAMPDVMKSLQETEEGKNLEVLLTDLHPNPEFVQQFNADSSDHISYREESLDATHLENAPEGLKTMMNSFHHMPPDKAKSILKSAQDNRQPLLVYEIGENNIPTIVWWLALPISLPLVWMMACFLTFFVRPLTWRQIVFTFIIPIIPPAYAWDGQASLVRMYTFDDLNSMIDEFRTDEYTWEMGQAKTKDGKKRGTYLMGIPKAV